MRVTNSMISSSARQHISTAKNKLLTAEEQYTTEKKIQRPSDDPTIASRALKFRNTYSQLTQYVEKNVKDAMNWMDSTEGAMKIVSSIFTNMKERLNQGANDPLEADQRTSVITELRQYADSIFEDCANSDYAGRYLFTGYRTDTSLLFPTDTTNLEYEITENFQLSDIALSRNVTSNIAYSDTATAEQYAAMEAKVNECYRLQLAYDNCSKEAITGSNTVLNMTVTKSDGTQELYSTAAGGAGNVVLISKDEPNAYNIEAYNEDHPDAQADILYVYDAGELVLSKELYADMQENDATFSVDYAKKEFKKSDIRPEMYFECKTYNTVSMKTIEYADPSGQDINYEVSLRQEMTVNTQAKDAFSTGIYRSLDYIQQTIDGVNEVESRIAEVEKKIADTPADDDETLKKLEVLKESLEEEKELRVSVMNSAFGAGLTMVDNTSQTLDVSIAKLGAKYNRLRLTHDKLLDQQNTAEEQLSNNEDMSISDAIINLTQADNLYQASLSATAKILGNSLLNYI